ncbi:potassium channel subfamily K member 18 isoform X5 [Ischnura elegans]|uniref:potassium channel subfamily K member 18 isoform X5 n=1 Tax=Ischnura elegans TaxID=197161 RepID=UPI001ED8AF0E|nr:potassium channel subfamily K member 18 isoform X5 [Ischnura elegans]
MDGETVQPPLPRRTRLRVQIPAGVAAGGGGHSAGTARPSSFISFPVPGPGPRTPITPGVAVTGPDGALGTLQFYPGKASGYVFQQFKGFKDFTLNTAKSGLSVGEKTAFWCYGRVRDWSTRWFTHIFLLTVVMLYSVLGAAIFVAVEGPHEDRQREDIFRERKAFLHKIRDLSRGVAPDATMISGGRGGPSVGESVPPVSAAYPDDEQWEVEATASLRAFEEQLYASYTLGVKDTEKKVWGFWNAVFFCGTVFTTIGYGHIAPATTTGRAITIVYAIIGIPMFLILLADFGKLFTRGIKFLWAFIRRLYYTGSCRKVRTTAPVQEVMKGVQLVYDFATFRRPSQVIDGNGAAGDMGQPQNNTMERTNSRSQSLGATLASPEGSASQGSMAVGTVSVASLTPDSVKVGRVSSVYVPAGNDPGTPAPSQFEVDDEFNLPISVAIFILLLYIFFGATIYYSWEDWGFFESFYFVFISMSTIGFGDYVPQHPMYMMASIIYLVFGLALTSMCINVVQEKLSDSFRQASVKLGATMGLQVTEEEEAAAAPQKVELAEVHSAGKKKDETN